ncbi:head-tail adaptor protein [Paracoccus stylophorae]|uniref:Head-tail adaptor protein n=1 Tax=Paracoccus stylophorae TaxID=659350 RepID=A0ABY7SRU1_9RHOB|nr:head-tail adaptor protein [Paracoccus stylophorae]WCR09580.1 head-tail adaptor protein [Paracoccus stylophorae]
MRAGKLQARIQIERLELLVNDNGTARQRWLPILTTRAEVKEASTDEFLLNQIVGDKNRAVFLIRWPVQTITTADRLTYAGRAWNIVGLQEIGRRRGLEIRCEAVG